MQRVEYTIQKRLTAALLLFVGSCLVVLGAFVLLSVVSQRMPVAMAASGAARWVLDWHGWVFALTLVGTTALLWGVMRRTLSRETNIFAAASLATFNLLLVVGLFGLLLLGQSRAMTPGGLSPADTRPVVQRPARQSCATRLTAGGRCPGGAQRALALNR